MPWRAVVAVLLIVALPAVLLAAPRMSEQRPDPKQMYLRLWQGSVGQEVQVVVQRETGFEAITVRPMDRYRFYRTTGN